jgi:hypothetical protein
MELECLRADDIWGKLNYYTRHFDLIFCSRIVIVDVERNPKRNV